MSYPPAHHPHRNHSRTRRRTAPALGLAAAIAAGLLASPLAPSAATPAHAAAPEFTESFEGAASATTAPEGWVVDSRNTDGMRAGWEGWTFHTTADVVADFGASGDRGSFARAEGLVAVVHSDTNRPATGNFDSTLWAPAYELEPGGRAVRVAFDSHYKQGQAPQNARLVARFDGGEAVLVEQFSTNRLNQRAERTVDVPEGARSVEFGWSYLESSNNWFWMIDNVSIAEAAPVDVAPVVESAAKPVARAGGATTVRLSGLRAGQQVVASLAIDATGGSGEGAGSGSEVRGIPAAAADGTVSFDAGIPADQAPGLMELRLSGDGIVPFTIPITVLADAPAGATTTEPKLWFDGFEAASGEAASGEADGTGAAAAGWERSGTAWETLDRAASLERYGTDRRHAFTRASGTMAVAESAHAAFDGALTSAPIEVTGGDALELRFDSHVLVRGAGAQRGTVTAVFDSGERIELAVLGAADEESSQRRLPLGIPADAASVRFEFAYAADAGSGSWRIDDVELVRPLAPLAEDAAPSAAIDIFSDVQGANARLKDQVMPGFAGLTPAASTIVANGDLTGQGTPAQYDAYFAAFEGGGADRYTHRVSTIGNHEFFGANGSDAYIERFLARTGMGELGPEDADPARRGLWGEVVVDGELPLLWIGSEFHDYPSHTGSGPFVELGEQQFGWLRDRLAHWSAEGKPVVLMSHHVFNDSVSGTYANFYRGDFGADTERIEALLAQHPNVTVLTSHTHWSPKLNDWSVEQRFDPAASHGPTIVNTASVTTQYGPSGDWNETAIGGADPVGLRAALYGDRLRVTAYSFGAGGAASELKHVDVPLPAEAPVDPEPGEPAAVSLGADTVEAGAKLAVSGAGFAAAEGLRIELHSEPVELAAVAADAEGAFSTEVTIPASTPAGAHRIVVVRADGSEVAAELAVTSGAVGPTDPTDPVDPADPVKPGDGGTEGATPGAGSGSGSGTLPITGGQTLMAAGILAAALAAAGGFLLARRRSA